MGHEEGSTTATSVQPTPPPPPSLPEEERTAATFSKAEPEDGPMLIRQLTGSSAQDHDAQIELVCKAMAEVGNDAWKTVAPSDIRIEDVSGLGGCATFRVTAAADTLCEPSSLCLHNRSGSSHLNSRIMAAARAFADAGLAPQWCCHGGDWWLEPWEGTNAQHSDNSAEMWRARGIHLANVHQIPTEWWVNIKQQLIEDLPLVATFPEGSLAWSFLQRDAFQQHLLGERKGGPLSETVLQKWASSINTVHPVGARIVTTHGDFHPGNMIRLADGKFKSIDFEFTCVTHAIQDLAFGLACISSKEIAVKEAYLHAYLEALGEPCSDLDVRALRVEAELAHMGSWHSGGVLAAWKHCDWEEADFEAMIDEISELQTRVRDSSELQTELLSIGLESFLSKAHPLPTILARAQKNNVKLLQAAQDGAERFVEKLAAREVEEANEGVSNTNGDTETAEDILSRATWCQPGNQQHPIEIGHSRALGLGGSFTCLAWVRHTSPSVSEEWDSGRAPLFMGDINPERDGVGWEACKEKIFHLELRHSKRFYFGFGWNDLSSDRTCRINEWDHVAFVFKNDGGGKSVIVNGETTTNGGGDPRPYKGDEIIWLGNGLSHGTNLWDGDIMGGVIIPEALTEQQVLKIATSTKPNDAHNDLEREK